MIKRKITILGSTGSVGRKAVSLIAQYKDQYDVQVLTANCNAKELAQQAILLNAAYVVIADVRYEEELKQYLQHTSTQVLSGSSAITQAAKIEVDWTLAAILGFAGLLPTMEAVKQGKTVALANKEILVCAGELFMAAVKQAGTTLLPVDSEHSAIFQLFDFQRKDQIEKITLTASGGPFRNATKLQMQYATPKEAIAHPNWNMGKKISIDSATMMNKGFEVIEAYHLFPIELQQIDVVLHPQSIVHSFVHYIDGSVLAHMGEPDMITPIAVALAWPARMDIKKPSLNLAQLGSLSFMPVDDERFSAITLAKQSIEAGGNTPIILNASNEVAVEAFLKGSIGFLDIMTVVQECLSGIGFEAVLTLEDVLHQDTLARSVARSMLLKYADSVAM